MIPKVYSGADDLQRMQQLVAESFAIAGDCGYMHVGDIPHRIYNGKRRQPIPDAAQYVRLWENDIGQLIGFSILYPHHKSLDFQIHANFVNLDLSCQMLADAEAKILASINTHDIKGDNLYIDVSEDDVLRIQAAEANGYQRGDLVYYLTNQSLDKPIPEVVLPAGFHIRPAAGIHEAEALGKVHAGAFGSNWTLETYRAVMHSPGYILENEWVIVAPNGEFAAFIIMWFDKLNHISLFEPVGTHSDYQRMSLGRALMIAALHHMKAQSVKTAYVAHEADNPVSTAFYHSLGFLPIHRIFNYQKPIPR